MCMSGVFLYTLILSFASGIFLRSFFEINSPTSLAFVTVAIGLVLIGRRKSTSSAAFSILLCGVSLLGFGGGMLRLALTDELASPSLLAPQVGEKGTIAGQVVREPEVRAQSTNLTVLVGDEKILVQTDRHTPVRYGDTVQLFGKLTLSKPFVTELGREFDYPGYLAAQGIVYTMSFGSVTVTDTTTGNQFLKKLFLWKQQFMQALELQIPEPQVGLGEGLILGVKQALGADIETAFRRSGIIHIVVLSGYNIMIIVTFVMMVFSLVLPFRLRSIAGMISIIVFALLVGAGASVVRASIMALLGLLALVLGRRYNLLRALCAAGAGMLLYNPLLLVHDVGFQLSFMATLGLVLVAPHLEEIVGGSKFSRFGQEFLVATAATQIAVLPLLFYQIGQFSLIALVVNVIVLPVVPLAMLSTFLTGAVSLVSPALAIPFAYLAYALLTFIIGVATRFASLPFAAFDVPPFPFIVVPLMYAGLGYLVYRKLRSDRVPEAMAVPSLADWTVVEESTLVFKEGETTPTENGRGQSPRPSSDELPIFFR